MVVKRRFSKTRSGLCLTGLLWLAFGLCMVAAGAAHAGTEYAIGQIPDQTAYQGYTRSFGLFVTGTPAGVAFSMVATPQPAGPLTLDASTGAFTYKPAAQDRTPFTIAFTAQYPGGNAAQSIVMTPETSALPEADAFDHVESEPDATGYTSWQEESILGDVELNDQTWSGAHPARKVSISGVTIVFDRSLASSPAKVYGDPGAVGANLNIRELVITGDTVIIRDPLRFPQTTVTINARELRFEDKADADAGEPGEDQHPSRGPGGQGDRPGGGCGIPIIRRRARNPRISTLRPISRRPGTARRGIRAGTLR